MSHSLHEWIVTVVVAMYSKMTWCMVVGAFSVGMCVHVIEHYMLNNIHMYCTRSPLTFQSAHVELGTMEEEHELMVTVVVATVYGDVVTIGADDVCELLGIAKLKSIL